MNARIDEDDEAETAEFVDTLLKQFVPRLANRIELLNLGGGAIRRADPSTVDNHGGNRAAESLRATVPQAGGTRPYQLSGMGAALGPVNWTNTRGANP